MTNAKTGSLCPVWRMAECMRRLLLCGLMLLPSWTQAQSGVEAGRRLFADPQKGNCIACHQAPADATIKSFSRIGPSLVDVKSRVPDRNKLRDIIWNPLASRPSAFMPPFGRNRILTDAEIDAIVLYVETL